MLNIKHLIKYNYVSYNFNLSKCCSFFFKLSYSSIRIGVQTALQNVLQGFSQTRLLKRIG